MVRRTASRRLHVARALLSAGTLLFAPAGARAQSSPDAVRAQQLFDEARQLMTEKRYSEACPKFAESQVLDPGGGTILNLGICRKLEGRTATAFRLLSEALAQARAAGRSDRVATAERHLAELTPKLSRLTVVPPPNAPPDLVLSLDGAPLDAERWRQAFPLDPGEHELTATRPGYVPWSQRFAIAPEADSRTIEAPVLSPEAPPTPPPVPPAVVAPPPPAPVQPVPVPPSAERGSSRTVGYVLAGVGGAALVTGAYFGARALSLKASSDRFYVDGHCTQQSCVDDWDDARTAALVSNIAIGVGLATLGVGVYFLVRPEHDEKSAQHVTLTLGPLRSGAALRAGAEF